ncbi:Protein of unknown function DUF868 [Macleaya cordata]|uniref:Uncharacterized protein n=1 Tax=Macleaya cordata TaxID=56857 RepID=A0A200R7Z2_MACCD|nr:Protein of unknown function DUF868 [Macleaya cordata]
MIPSCFSNPNNLTNNSQTPQNLITCIYQTQLCDIPIYLTLTWSKSHLSHSLTIHASDSFSLTVSLYSSTLSFFRNRPGSKSISLNRQNHRVKIYWDFTRAEFIHNSAEPKSSFYIAITCNSQIEFFLGDLLGDAVRRCRAAKMCTFVEPTLLSRREHVFGHQNYSTNVQLLGSRHEIGIVCSGGILKVKVDGVVSLIVKRLAWKFRGNERIKVGELEVEFYWDVFNWVVAGGSGGGVNGGGYGVFVFQVGDDHGGVWPEMVGPEKRLMKRKSLSSSPSISLSPTPSCSSVLQWAEESSSDGGRSSCCSSSTTRSGGSSGGFSLLLYAWKSD